MLKRYFLNNKKRNFSTASIWIKGGSDLDSVGKKGINKILSSLLTETEFKKVKKSSTDYLKKDKENQFNICFEKWRKIVYSNHPYAFNTIGNANDVSKITYEDVLLEFKNLKNREKYLISNNHEINGENFGTLEKKILKEISDPLNNNLSTTNRFDYINNLSLIHI